MGTLARTLLGGGGLMLPAEWRSVGKKLVGLAGGSKGGAGLCAKRPPGPWSPLAGILRRRENKSWGFLARGCRGGVRRGQVRLSALGGGASGRLLLQQHCFSLLRQGG